jgi:hypothetical protein
MSRLFRLRLLLALVFVLAQSFALAHATRHELAQPGKTLGCEVCAVAHASGGLPGSAPHVPLLQPAPLAPNVRPPAAPADLQRPAPRSRAPPAGSV